MSLTNGETVVSRITDRVHWMRSNLIHPIKDKIMLHDHHPESVSPVPSVIFHDSMGINLDPEVEGDQRPSEDPSENVHQYRLVGWEIEVRPGKQRVRKEITLNQLVIQWNGGLRLLEKNDINQLAEHQPSIELRRDSFPLVTLIHFHLQFSLPPFGPFSSFFSSTLGFYIKPSPLFQSLDNPFPFTLLSQYPGETPVVTSSPECKIEQEED
jgi:hypothetical protein